MRVLAIFAGGYAVAAFSACYFLREEWLLHIAVAAAILCAGAMLCRKRWPDRSKQAVLLLAGLTIGLLWSGLYRMIFLAPARELDGRTIRMSAVVAEYPEIKRNGCSVIVEVETASDIPVTAVLYTDGKGERVQPGDHIETVAYCTVGSRSLSGEDISYYTAQGIFLQAQAYGRLDISRPNRIPVKYWPIVLSQSIKRGIDQSFPEDVSPLIKALTTGDRQDMSDATTNSLRRAGLSHMVAVSGMHLAMLAGVLNFVLGRGKRSTVLAVILSSVLFCGVAGQTPSVVRAAIMVSLLQLAPLLGRERDDSTALLFALMLLLLWNPMSAAHVGLQLSFAAVTGILFLSESIRKWMYRALRLDQKTKRKFFRLPYALLRFGTDVLAVTLGATIFTMPLSAIYFGSVSLIAPLSNLLIAWAVSPLLLGGLLTGLLGLALPAVAMAVSAAITPLARFFLWAAEGFSKPGLASIPLDVVYYRIWLLFVCLLLLLGLLMPGKKRLRVPLTMTMVTLAAAVMFTAMDFRQGSMVVTVLDVGQGQSVLIRTGEQLTIVDCGGFGGRNAGDITADYLQARSVNKVDRIILSHYDEDHINGVPQLMRRIEVGSILLPDAEKENSMCCEILNMARDKNVHLEFILEDICVASDKQSDITVYAPVDDFTASNEKSLTVVATMGESDVLLTGDMGSSTEELLLDYVDLPDAELMVAGHHGSNGANSLTLLEEVMPEIIVVSVGRDNRNGHPGAETMERFAEVGAQVYRTDLQGTITVCLVP